MSTVKLTQSEFGPSNTPIARFQVHIHPIQESCVDLRPARKANTESEVMKASNSYSIMIHILEDRGHCRNKY